MKTLYHSTLLRPGDITSRAKFAAELLAKHDLARIPLAVRGVSGLVMGGAITAVGGHPLVIVRKDKANSHSMFGVEGPNKLERYAIVDDMIASGSTIHRIVSAMNDTYPGIKLDAIVLYNSFDMAHKDRESDVERGIWTKPDHVSGYYCKGTYDYLQAVMRNEPQDVLNELADTDAVLERENEN